MGRRRALSFAPLTSKQDHDADDKHGDRRQQDRKRLNRRLDLADLRFHVLSTGLDRRILLGVDVRREHFQPPILNLFQAMI